MKTSGKNKTKVLLLALATMAFWGSLFPCVKLGYRAFNIDTNFVPNVILFAGVRFLVCGAIISLIAIGKGDRMKPNVKTELPLIIACSLFTIILHYTCTYTGLTMADSSITALLKQLGTFLFIPFSFLFFKDDRFSVAKLIGGICGFAGIFALNYSTSSGFCMGIGEILIICASFCSVIGAVFSKKAMKTVAPFALTGISQAVGGVVLTLLGLSLGGSFGSISIWSVLIFVYICTASIMGYCIWNSIVKNNDLSHLFIIKFTEPIFAAIFGALLLNENIFKPQYLIALTLIILGIIISERKR